MHKRLSLAAALVIAALNQAPALALPPPPFSLPPLDFSALLADRPRAPSGTCAPDGLQASGAVYRICMPAEGEWNGDLFVYAHGYVPVTRPIGIPEDQLSAGGVSVTETVTALGYAFATTSYSVNGLAVQQGLADVIDLVRVFEAQYGKPYRVVIVGVSEGALVTTLAVEQRPDVFDGGLAACGPIGDFGRQLDHFQDVRVLFDYFYPGALPPSPVNIPPYLVDDAVWGEWAGLTITARLQGDLLAGYNLLNVAHLPIDAAYPITTAGASIIGALGYNVLGANNARAVLGGQPYGNAARVYTGTTFPYSDVALNAGVERFTAEVTATLALASYQTSGLLQRPLVTIHTTGDPVVPIWHEALYGAKVAAQGREALRTDIVVQRYGHCSFTAQELQTAFLALMLKVGYPALRFTFLPVAARR